MDVRNLAIAEMLRGILMQQQDLYDTATKDKPEGAEIHPLMTKVIIEEAHAFLSARRVTRMPTLRDQLMKIAKTGLQALPRPDLRHAVSERPAGRCARTRSTRPRSVG